MKDLFEYFKRRTEHNKYILNAEGKKFFGEIHMIFVDGKLVHTRDWQVNDVAMIIESRKIT